MISPTLSMSLGSVTKLLLILEMSTLPTFKTKNVPQKYANVLHVILLNPTNVKNAACAHVSARLAQLPVLSAKSRVLLTRINVLNAECVLLRVSLRQLLRNKEGKLNVKN